MVLVLLALIIVNNVIVLELITVILVCVTQDLLELDQMYVLCAYQVVDHVVQLT